MVIYLSKNRWSDKEKGITGEEDNRDWVGMRSSRYSGEMETHLKH